MPKGDARRASLLAVLKKHPDGLMANQIAPQARIYEPKLAYYHLRVLIEAGVVVREARYVPHVRGRGARGAFFYRLIEGEK
jgi:predicted ArsR family transcriptional regulator